MLKILTCLLSSLGVSINHCDAGLLLIVIFLFLTIYRNNILLGNFLKNNYSSHTGYFFYGLNLVKFLFLSVKELGNNSRLFSLLFIILGSLFRGLVMLCLGILGGDIISISLLSLSTIICTFHYLDFNGLSKIIKGHLPKEKGKGKGEGELKGNTPYIKDVPPLIILKMDDAPAGQNPLITPPGSPTVAITGTGNSTIVGNFGEGIPSAPLSSNSSPISSTHFSNTTIGGSYADSSSSGEEILEGPVFPYSNDNIEQRFPRPNSIHGILNFRMHARGYRYNGNDSISNAQALVDLCGHSFTEVSRMHPYHVGRLYNCYEERVEIKLSNFLSANPDSIRDAVNHPLSQYMYSQKVDSNGISYINNVNNNGDF
jgi:hypothetical protein